MGFRALPLGYFKFATDPSGCFQYPYSSCYFWQAAEGTWWGLKISRLQRRRASNIRQHDHHFVIQLGIFLKMGINMVPALRIFWFKFKTEEKITEGVSGRCHHGHHYHRALPHFYLIVSSRLTHFQINFWPLMNENYSMTKHSITHSCELSQPFRFWKCHPLESKINYFNVFKLLRQFCKKVLANNLGDFFPILIQIRHEEFCSVSDFLCMAEMRKDKDSKYRKLLKYENCWNMS